MGEVLGINYEHEPAKANLALTGTISYFTLPKVYEFLQKRKILPNRTDSYEKGLISAARKYFQDHFCYERESYKGELEIDFSKAELPDFSAVGLAIEVAKNIGPENLRVIVSDKNIHPFNLAKLERILNIQVS